VLALAGLIALSLVRRRWSDSHRQALFFCAHGRRPDLPDAAPGRVPVAGHRHAGFSAISLATAGSVAFCLAVLAGLNALWLQRLSPRLAANVTALLIVFIITLAMPTLYPDEWEHTTVDTTPAAYHAAELRGLQRATTFSDEYLPSTVIIETEC
jgi:hypothetical protein